MPAYSFQLQFVEYVENGTKTHTIRRKRKQRPKAGQTFYGYYAMRTKQCRKLVEAPLVRVQEIVIVPSDRVIVIDHAQLSETECDLFAWRDGFRFDGAGKEISPMRLRRPHVGSFAMMLDFWREHHPDTYEGIFEGDLIHWDFDRRVQ